MFFYIMFLSYWSIILRFNFLPDRPSVSNGPNIFWHNFVTERGWKPPILKVIRDISDSYRSATQGLRVPFVVLCCQFLKAIILKTFSEIVLAFLPVESNTNILYVNINFPGNVFFGFGKYCGKVTPEPAVSHRFWAAALTKMFFQYFFQVDTL